MHQWRPAESDLLPARTARGVMSSLAGQGTLLYGIVLALLATLVVLVALFVGDVFPRVSAGLSG